MCSVHLNLEFPFPVAQNRKKQKIIPKVLKNKMMQFFFLHGNKKNNKTVMILSQMLFNVCCLEAKRKNIINMHLCYN